MALTNDKGESVFITNNTASTFKSNQPGITYNGTGDITIDFSEYLGIRSKEIQNLKHWFDHYNISTINEFISIITQETAKQLKDLE